MRTLFLFFFITTFTSFVSFAQPETNTFKQYLASTKNSNGENEEIIKLYELLNYRPVWIAGNATAAMADLKLLTEEASLFSSKKDEDTEVILAGMSGLKNGNDSFAFETNLTSILLSASHTLFWGSQKPAFGYYGITYTPDCTDIPAFVAEYIRKNRLSEISTAAKAASPETALLLKKLQEFTVTMSAPSFHEVTVLSNKLSAGNSPLVTKLYQLGIISSTSSNITDSTLKEILKETQRMFCLLDDAVLRTTLIKELNVPLATRVAELKTTINNYKWLACLKKSSVILVNIPSAEMNVYENGDVVLQMKMIVGKKSTPTPTLTSKVDEVILYPYWHVPRSIAVKELLPAIKKNRAVLDAGNYQLINASGKIISPAAVNWRAMNASNFPYTIRQSTGCDNSLGLLKLNFYSPFGVYLHDTPNPALFMVKQRFFSHGCMRMEKPFELGHLLMKNNSIAIDTLEQKGCIRNQEPVTVKTEEKMPVVVWYTPAGVSPDQKVLFFPDVYDKFIYANTSKK
jgi:murein L,D-transpeptidase YcbB/YkuD